ncbi:MAG TPA: hypothetical protein VIS99_09065 [Terrimicrobiaceae bacterium]
MAILDLLGAGHKRFTQLPLDTEVVAEARQYDERFLNDLMEIVHSRRPAVCREFAM